MAEQYVKMSQEELEELGQEKGAVDDGGGGGRLLDDGSGEFKAVLKGQIDEILPTAQRFGFVQVLQALLLHVPWIYLLNNISYNIKYRG